MNLVLTNFKNHRYRTFDLPESGLTLIHGVNGAGKSTIFKAICFAFYGKIKRCYSHGTKTCSVQLTSAKLKISITRTRTPNRLLVTYKGNVYEDDAGQGVINKLLGTNEDEFEVSSYFDQRKEESIFSMSPAEQLDFLGIVASFDEKYKETKEQTKEHCKSIESELIKLKAHLVLIDKQLDDKSSSLLSYKFPEVFDAIAIKSEHEHLIDGIKTLQNSIKTKRSLLDKIRQSEDSNRKAEKEQIKLETELKCREEIRQKLGEIKSEDDIQNLVDNVSKLRQTYQNLMNIGKANKLKKEHIEQLTSHNNKIREQLESLNSKLISKEQYDLLNESISNYDKIRELYDKQEQERLILTNEKNQATLAIAQIKKDVLLLFNLKKFKPGISLANFIDKKLIELTKSSDELSVKFNVMQCEILKCPSCNNKLQLINNELCVIPKTLDVEYSNDQIDSTETELNRLLNLTDFLNTQLEKLKEYQPKLNIEIPKNTLELPSIDQHTENVVIITNQREYNNSIIKLQNEPIPTSILRLEVQYKDLLKGLSTKDTSKNLNELEAEIKNYDKLIEEAWRVRGEHAKVSREISKLEKTLQLCKSKGRLNSDELVVISSKDLQTEIYSLEKQEEVLEKKRLDMKDSLKLVEKYEVYHHSKVEFDKLQVDKDKLSNDIQHMSNRLQGADGVKLSSKEAEFVALEKTIKKINGYAKTYIDKFFDKKMVVEMAVKRTTKKGDAMVHPAIEINLVYNGEPYESIDDLCGGEFQMCNAAYMFAVNDMLNSKIMLLDECFSDLYKETDMALARKLNDLCENKQVLIISQRTIHGVFENSIEIQ